MGNDTLVILSLDEEFSVQLLINLFVGEICFSFILQKVNFCLFVFFELVIKVNNY